MLRNDQQCSRKALRTIAKHSTAQKANITSSSLPSSSSVPSSPSTQRIRAVQRTAGWTAKRVVICLQSVCNHLQCTDTYGAWGPQGLKLTKEIGKKISEVAHEKRSTFFLIQRIRIAIQRGNAACLLGTAPASETLDEVFDFVEHSSEIYFKHIFSMTGSLLTDSSVKETF